MLLKEILKENAGTVKIIFIDEGGFDDEDDKYGFSKLDQFRVSRDDFEKFVEQHDLNLEIDASGNADDFADGEEVDILRDAIDENEIANTKTRVEVKFDLGMDNEPVFPTHTAFFYPSM